MLSASAATANAATVGSSVSSMPRLREKTFSTPTTSPKNAAAPMMESVGRRHSAMPTVISMWPSTLAARPKRGGCARISRSLANPCAGVTVKRFGAPRQRERAFDLVEAQRQAFLGREIEPRRVAVVELHEQHGRKGDDAYPRHTVRARDPPQQVLDDGNRFAAGDQHMAELRQERQEFRGRRVGAPGFHDAVSYRRAAVTTRPAR